MKPSRVRWRDAPAIGMCAAYIANGVYLLAVGQLETIVSPGDGSVIVNEPMSAGLLPLVVGGLVLWGIWSGRERVAWAGGVFALAFGVTFLFSLAGVSIPLAVLLLASLTLRHLLARRQASIN